MLLANAFPSAVAATLAAVGLQGPAAAVVQWPEAAAAGGADGFGPEFQHRLALFLASLLAFGDISVRLLLRRVASVPMPNVSRAFLGAGFVRDGRYRFFSPFSFALLRIFLSTLLNPIRIASPRLVAQPLLQPCVAATGALLFLADPRMRAAAVAVSAAFYLGNVVRYGVLASRALGINPFLVKAKGE